MPTLSEHEQCDTLQAIVADLIAASGKSQRDLMDHAGLSKDQISRALRGTRGLSLTEALALLDAAGLPARGALTLGLFNRNDIANAWTSSGLTAFFEMLVGALPDALELALGDFADRVDPRWGAPTAQFVAKRIAHHIGELVEREQRLSEFNPRFGGDRG